MKGIVDLFKRFFGVGFRLQTYLNLLYLTLALPLGLLYFVLLTVGFSLGLGTSVILIGILILLLTLALAWVLAALERQLAIWLLRVNIGPLGRQAQAPGFLNWLQSYLGNPVTWSSLLFLFLKLPIGVITFSVTVTLLSLSVGMLLAPLTYAWLPVTIIFWRIDTLPAALIVFVLGLAVTGLSLHLLNLLARALGRWAQMLLGSAAPAPASRPAQGSCLLPCAAVLLFACAALVVCSAAVWAPAASRREPERTAAVTATPPAFQPAATAAAKPSATASPRPTDTPTPAFTAQPTATEVPAATDTPTISPPTATVPSPTSSATASATPTPLPTFTPTSAGPDPMANAGSVLFEETFAPARYYWGTGKSQFSGISVAGGAMTVIVKQPRRVVWTFSGAPASPDFYFSGTVTATTCVAGDNFGLAFRAKDDSALFLYGISCDGRYLLTQYVGGAAHPLVAPDEAEAIVSGQGAANQLGVRAAGRQLDLYANGQFLATATADATGQGLFGVYAASAQTSGLTAAFSQLEAWVVTP